MSTSVIDAKALQAKPQLTLGLKPDCGRTGPICPHCGGVDRISKMGGKSTRIGVYKCYQCRKPFTVKVGTVFEASHVPMRLLASGHVPLCSSKKGISAISFTGPWASLSRPHGSCRIAFARLCASSALNHGRRWRDRRSG